MRPSVPKPASSIIHNFGNSKHRSHCSDKLAIWGEMYVQLFEDFDRMESHLGYSREQLGGVDRKLFFRDKSLVVTVDEKYRERNRKTGRVYNDCLCETYSDHRQGLLGWILKQLLCDYILYAILPLGVGYLMDRKRLQSAWQKYGQEWQQQYGVRVSYNDYDGRQWESHNVPVPFETLTAVMGDFIWVAHFGERHDYLEDYFKLRVLPHATPTDP